MLHIVTSKAFGVQFKQGVRQAVASAIVGLTVSFFFSGCGGYAWQEPVQDRTAVEGKPTGFEVATLWVAGGSARCPESRAGDMLHV